MKAILKLTAAFGLLFIAILGGQEAPVVAPCPIAVLQIHPHWLFGQGDPWGSYLMIGFKNISAKPIIAIRFGVSFINALGERSAPAYFNLEGKMKPGGSTSAVWGDGVNVGAPGTKIQGVVWAEKIRFKDDSFFVDDGTHSCAAKQK